MNWRKSECGREIKAGDFHIHRSLDKFTAYRVKPFKNFGLFTSAKKAKNICENDSNGQNELLL